MYKYLLKPLKVLIGVYMFTGLGIASDLAQLTNFNILEFIKSNSPQSYYCIVFITLFVYLILVIIEIIRKNQNDHSIEPDHTNAQFIKTGNVKNSTIIQIRKDKED